MVAERDFEREVLKARFEKLKLVLYMQAKKQQHFTVYNYWQGEVDN